MKSGDGRSALSANGSSALSELTAAVEAGELANSATLSTIERELRDAADLVRQTYRTDDVGEVETEAGDEV